MKRKIFSILLALCMVVSLPAPMMADTSTTDGIDTKDELQNAITSAGDGDTITLGGDIVTDGLININKSITLDLNGHSISRGGTASGACNLYITTTGVTVTDSAKTNGDGIVNTGQGMAIYMASGAELTLTDVNVTGSDMGVLVASDNGKLTVGNGTVIKGTNTTSECGDGIRAYNATIIVNEGAQISASAVGTAIESYGTSTVTMNGKITSGDYGVQIYGGTVTINSDMTANTAVLFCSDDGNNGTYLNDPTGIITGGTYNVNTVVTIDNTSNVNDYNPTLTIKGGIFSDTSAGDYFPTTDAGYGFKEIVDTNGIIMYQAHEHDWSDATCTAASTCTICNSETGDPLGHDMQKTTTVVAPTCTEEGYTVYKCSHDGCNVTENKDITKAKGHDYDEKVTKEPTTEAEGEKTFTCKHCGDTYTEAIEKLPASEPAPEPTPEPEPVKDGLVVLEDGTIAYYENGTAATDKWVLVDTDWYYFDTEGAALIGWHEIKDVYYYFHENGIMAADEWIGEYYVNENGAWIEDAVEEKWVKDTNGQWWYQEPDGSYPANEWEYIDDEWYYFGADGYMEIGWEYVNNEWYYMNTSGAMETGWIKDNGTWYYLEESGAMSTGWVLDGETWYYTNTSGAMQTGWEYVNNEWYYMNASGAMQTGWIKDNGTWYYLDKSGAMLSNTTVDGYKLDESGAWIQ